MSEPVIAGETWTLSNGNPLTENHDLQVMNQNYETVLSITNIEECKTGKVKCFIYIDPLLGVMIEGHPTDCLAQMEAAMRAIEPFIAFSDMTSTRTSEYCNAVCQAMRQVVEVETRRADATELWHAAKQCWRTP